MTARRALALAALLCGCGPAGGALYDDDDDAATPEDFGPETATAAELYASDHVAEIHIEMVEADMFALAAQTNTIFSLLEGEDCMDSPLGGDAFTWFSADIIVDGERIEDVGVRKKGLIGSLSSEKPGLKVKFDKWVPGQTYRGLERLTLNNSLADRSLVKQCLGYDLFRDAGIAAPRCSFAHLSVNEFDLGVYVNVEPVKRSFLRWAYDGLDRGDLYEGTVSDFRAGFTRTFEPETDATDPDLGPIEAIREALEIPSDAAMLEALGAVLDVDQFLRFWAMEHLVGHIDGYAGNRNNFYVHRPEGSERMEFLPWGIDWTFVRSAAFGSDTERVVLANSALSRRLWENTSTRDRYLAALQDLLLEVWDRDALSARADRLADLVEPFATPDAQRVPAQSALRDFIRTRRAEVEALLEEPLPVFTEPLGGSLCQIPRGSMRTEFSAPWDTLSSPNPLQLGGSTTSGVFDDVPFSFEGGAIAGPGQNDAVVIAALGFIEPGLIWQPVTSIPSWAAATGTLPITNGNPWVVLNEYDTATQESSQRARVWSGEIVLTEYEPWTGGTVAGSIEGPLHSSAGF